MFYAHSTYVDLYNPLLIQRSTILHDWWKHSIISATCKYMYVPILHTNKENRDVRRFKGGKTFIVNLYLKMVCVFWFLL